MKSLKNIIVTLLTGLLISCNPFNGLSNNSEKHSNESHSQMSENSSSLKTSEIISDENNLNSELSEDINSEENKSENGSNSSSNEKNNIVNIDLYAFNDLHGNVLDTENGLGISKTSTLLKSFMDNQENPILLSQGDMWQGSVESNETKGKIVTEWMNDLNFTSMTLGNHEYDWGSEYVKLNAEMANFPTLAINVMDSKTNQRVDYCDASVVVEKDGAKIGIIGAIGDCYSSISASKVKDVYFKVGKELTNLVKNESIRLREEENCDFIIFSHHDDYDNYDIELSKGGYVDIVLEGHSHQNYQKVDMYGVHHLQGKGSNYNIQYVDIDINIENNTFEINEIKSYYTLDYLNLENDEFVDSLLEKYADEIGDAYSTLGYNDKLRNSTELRNKVAELYLEIGLEKWSNYDIVLGGGYLSCRNPYELKAGNVTYADLYNLFPFDNNIELCSIDGASLLNKFVENTSYYNAYSTYGKSVINSLNANSTYYIVVDTYTSDYAYNNLTVIDTYKEDYYARDALADFIKDGGYTSREQLKPNLKHYGTIDDPYDIKDALYLASLSNDINNGTWGYYKATVGDVTNIKVGSSSGDLGNFYLSDEEGNSLYVYYMSKYFGSSTSNNWISISDIKVGDEILFYGQTYTYNGSPQFGGENKAITINNVPTNGTSMETACDVLQAIEYAKLYDSKGIKDMYVKGEICTKPELNSRYNSYSFYLLSTIDLNTTINVYGVNCDATLLSLLVVGANIIIKTTLKMYLDGLTNIPETYLGDIVSID